MQSQRPGKRAPERRDGRHETKSKALESSGQNRVDFPSGRRIYASIKFPLRDAAGRIYAIGGICMDRTERIQAEAARRETERLLHAIIDSAGAVITVKDTELRYMEINAFAARLAGRPREALLGKRATDVFAAADAAAYEAHDRHVLETGETAEFELIFNFDEVPGALAGAVGYSLDLFDRSTIQTMIVHLRTLLGEIVRNPEGRLSSFSLLTEEERAVYSSANPSGAQLSQKELDQLLLRLNANTGA